MKEDFFEKKFPKLKNIEEKFFLYNVEEILSVLPIEFNDEIKEVLSNINLTRSYIYKLSKKLKKSYDDTLGIVIYFLFKKIIFLSNEKDYNQIYNIFRDIFSSDILVVKSHGIEKKYNLFSIFIKIRQLSKRLDYIDYSLYMLERKILDLYLEWYFKQWYLLWPIEVDDYINKLSSYYDMDWTYYLVEKKIKNYKKLTNEINKKVWFVKLRLWYEYIIDLDNMWEFFRQFWVFLQIFSKFTSGEYIDEIIDADYLIKITGIDIVKLEKVFISNLRKLSKIIEENAEIVWLTTKELQESKYIIDIVAWLVPRHLIGSKYYKYVRFSMEEYLKQWPQDWLYLFEKINKFINILASKYLLST